MLALFGEKVDHAIQRLIGAVGMQRRHAQVAGLGKRNRVIHRFTITNLADQNHIGRLPQSVAQRGVPGIGIHANFTLGDHAILVLVHKLNRVFDGDDMAVGIFIAVTNHCSQ